MELHSYNRANDNWICGNQANGCPCRKGPDVKGNCGAATQCIPIKQEDRWHCSRSSILGGSCAQGPNPDGSCCQQEATCSPIPGYPQKKRQYLHLTSLFLLALLLLGLSPMLLESFAEPGPLAHPHAGIADCQSCHTQQETLTLTTIVKKAFNPVSIAEHNQQCLSCHAMGENSINPHQLTINTIDKIKQTLPEAHQQGIACATCHKEHQGELLPNKSAQTAYCLACHEKPLYRFPENHPEFIDYPIKGVKRIKFNHKAHIERYFAKKPEFAPDNCSNCHGIEQNGTPMVASFENSCQNCHQQDVFNENLAVGPKGFAVLSIPGLDIATLQANNINIGQWPEWSERAVEPVWQHILPGLTTQQDFLSLSDANEEALKHAQSVALNIKQYLYQLSLYGSSKTKDNWTLQLSQGELLNALYHWFPNIDEEIASINAGSPPPTQAVSPIEDSEEVTEPDHSDETSFDFDEGSMLDDDEDESLDDLFSDEAEAESDENLDELFGDSDDASSQLQTEDNFVISPEQWMKQGGWYLQDFALYYRSTGHADSNLKHWVGVAPALFNDESSGRCLKCHSIDSNSTPNWKTGKRNTIASKLTSFDHRQHMNMINTDSCQNCHAIAEYTENQQDFEPIKKQQCLDCHNEQTELNQCSACHNYHLPWGLIDFSQKSLFDMKQ